MFLWTLGVLVSFVIANSDGRQGEFETLEARAARYSVPQEIRDLVPVDFAASSLRKSRLKNQVSRNLLLHDQSNVSEMGKSSNVVRKRFDGKMERRPTDSTKQANKKIPKSSRKRPNKTKFVSTEKPSRFRTVNKRKSNVPKMIIRKQTVVPTRPRITVKNENSLSRIDTGMYSGVSNRKSAYSLENIRKAINALPQQLVKVVRDDIDCNDDPTTKSRDIRGPPCTLTVRWPGSSGEPWFSMSNKIRNWELLNN